MRRRRIEWSGRTSSRLPALVLSAVILSCGAVPAAGQAERPGKQATKAKTVPGKAGTTPAKADTPAKTVPPPPKAAAEQKPAVKLGLAVNDPRAFQGYTLLAPMDSTTTYLIDMQGRVVHTWESDCTPALCPIFLDNGHLLRAGSIGPEARIFGPGPGVGGKVQEFDWDGKLIWDYRFYNARQLPHHDITRLPNGNVILVVSDRKTNEEILAAGRRPELAGDSHSIPDCLIEVQPTGKTTGKVVWEWHVWDHLVQDYDKTKANYGDVAKHPELIHVNFGDDDLKPGTPNRGNFDWTHFNAVAYDPELDRVVVSAYSISEFWVIDHSTTTFEAAGHTGGKSGKGGDLLYRWGNPRAYRAGKKGDQTLFNQHNVHFIPKGLPGAGHLLLFNNGNGRADGNYSSVDELILPADVEGHYVRQPNGTFAPPQVVWSYSAPNKSDFYSSFISGTQRLANGNTLICSGANGTVFEVTPAKEIVWKYVNPAKRPTAPVGPAVRPGTVMTPVARALLGVTPDQVGQLDAIQQWVDARLQKLLTAEQRKQLGAKSQAPSAKSGEVLASADQDRLKLTAEQKKQLAAVQKEVDERFERVLTAAQKKQLKSAPAMGGPPPALQSLNGLLNQVKTLFGGITPASAPVVAGPTPAGMILSASQQNTLKLTPDQRKRLEEMQKDVDAKLDKLLTAEQKTAFKQLQQATTTAAGRGSPPGGLPLFRAYRFSPHHPGLEGRKLTPGKTVEELQPGADKKQLAKNP